VVQKEFHAPADGADDRVMPRLSRRDSDLAPDEKQLGRQYNTLANLLGHPEISKFVTWVRKRN
jgi:hypothetical protein